ncbi:MAG: DNA polymerase domain-containing protein, partial [Candidatus Aenigmarchaeota archaeon]|nr:DNA polymerase domain-containing protein [Candidatus Aenigmarchaeota archaeon]MDI6722192.1 DNA polymerase domain-containing protein [Candidatus Aenigmarchaeota archaeon]
MQAQILDVDYFMNGSKPVIRIYAKTENGNAVCIFYDKFLPYFYIVPGEHTQEKLNETGEITRTEEEEMFEPLGYNENKTRMIKITLTNPQDVPRIRESLSPHVKGIYEADILFKYRFMIDHGLYGMKWINFEGERIRTNTVKIPAFRAEKIESIERQDNVPLRHMSIDIECIPSDPRKPLNSKSDPVVIISLSFMPEFRGKKTLVLLTKNFHDEFTKGFPTEKEMLEGFVEIINAYDPDIITGYNINSFDLPYLLERFNRHKIPASFGRCDRNAFGKTFGMFQEFIIPGRVVIDPYQILKRDPWIKFHRYDLNTISKALLNDEKHDVEYGSMSGLWNGTREQLATFIEYARKDADLSLRLVVDRGMLDKFVEISKISGVLLQDAFGGQSKRVETMVLHEFKKRGFVMPPSPVKSDLLRRSKERESEGLKGATVLEPVKGLHAEGCVLVLDFKSLYPSIMRTFNISPDTVSKVNSKDCYISPSGAHFVKQETRNGILPDILSTLVDARAMAKKQMKSVKGDQKRILNAKQLAIKDMANSVHASTDIVVKDPKGNLWVYEIEDLFNTLSKKHNVISLGNTDVIELDGWEALSVDSNKSCFRPMYAISRHKSKGEMTKIQTPMAEIIVTDDHSVMVMEGISSNRQRKSRFWNLAEKGGSDISEKDIIAQASKVSLPERDFIFNWIKFLKSLPHEDIADIFLYIPKDLNLNKKGWLKNRIRMISSVNWPSDSMSLQKFVDRRIIRSSEGRLISRTGMTISGNCGIVPVYDIIEDGEALTPFYEDFLAAREEANYYTLPITSVTKLPRFIEERSFIAVGGAHQGRRKMPVIMPLTQELAELLGWFVAEGSTYKKNRSFKTSISNADKNNVERIKCLIEKCFAYKANVFNKDVTIGTKLAYMFFRHTCGESSYTKQVPDFIMNSNRAIRRVFLDGYYSGDGNKKIHRMNTISKRLAAQLNVIIKESGGVQHNCFDGLYRISKRKTSQGRKIVSGDLFGQQPKKISCCKPSEYVYDLSVKDTEMFVTAQGAVLHNSFYGYTGYIRARLYMIDVAGSITAYGRENIIKTKELVESNFPATVVYGDTDSIFVKTDITNLEDAKKLGEGIASYVTSRLTGYLELQFEKIYRTFLILTKKRYAGWKFEYTGSEWKDAIDMKGIETVRRDWCPLVSDLMLNVINITLKEGDIQKSIAEIRKTLDDLKNGRIPLEKLTVIKGITKSVENYDGVLPHIEVARKLAARNPHDPPKIGDRIGFVIIKGNNKLLSKRAEDPKYVKDNGLQIDSDYYISSQLLPPVERILSAVGVDKNELLGTGRQSRLGDIINGTKRKMKHEIKVDYRTKAEKPLDGWEELLCKKCNKSYQRMPLRGA